MFTTCPKKAFDFSAVYDPVTAIGARYCEARVWELFRHVALDPGFAAKYLDYAQGANLTNRMPLFVETGPHVALNTTFWQMRRHYENSWFDTTADVGAGPYHSVYRARPLSFEVDGTQYAFNRVRAAPAPSTALAGSVPHWPPPRSTGCDRLHPSLSPPRPRERLQGGDWPISRERPTDEFS